MKYEEKSKFIGILNDVEFDSPLLCFSISALIEEWEDDYEIEINDEDFTRFLLNIFVEFQHNVEYVNENLDTIKAIYDFLNFRRLCSKDEIEITEINVFKVLNKKFYQTITAYQDDNIEKVIKDLTGENIATYETLFDIFIKRFKQRHQEELFF